jgi:hypothetical protein
MAAATADPCTSDRLLASAAGFDAADGQNLFLSAYRFDRSLPQVYRATVPYVVILAVTILLITYLPWMTLAPLELVGWRAPP